MQIAEQWQAIIIQRGFHHEFLIMCLQTTFLRILVIIARLARPILVISKDLKNSLHRSSPRSQNIFYLIVDKVDNLLHLL